jgi:polyketide-type polyunsaturated fatty acid synthase PfaA
LSHRDEPIAVVGLGCLFPGSPDATSMWRTIAQGRDRMSEVPPSYWLAEDYYDPDPRKVDRVYSKRGAFLPEVTFDPLKYGVPPRLLPSTDTAQLLAMMVADQVLHDAAESLAQVSRERIGVVLGVCSGLELLGEMSGRLQRPVWRAALRAHGFDEGRIDEICATMSGFYTDWNESTFPGLLSNVVAGRVANNFDLGGTNCTTDAACASSFAALQMAVNELRLGQADMMITGGVDTANDPFTYMCFSKTPALSLSGVSRPFDERADGMMIGEGLGMMALRRLSDAEREGVPIYAVIRGVGSSSDGRSKSIYAPRWEGQRIALDRAYRSAGYAADTVELVEAHGTGTMAGDLAELTALRTVFEATGRGDAAWCALGSIKSQIGHTKAAAGAAGLLKVVMALHHRVLPPTLHIDRPAERLELDDSPFYLNSATRPWIRGAAHPRRASVSSFGFGGTNFHVAVEEYQGPRVGRLRAMAEELIVLGAADREQLAAACRAMADASMPAGTLAHVARASQEVDVAGQAARLAIVAEDEADLRGKLQQAAATLAHGTSPAFSLPTGVYYSERRGGGGLAFLFPGQGSQYLGMGADLAMAFDGAREVWDREASSSSVPGSAPAGGTGPLHRVVFPPPTFTEEDRRRDEARLTATEWAQPAIGAVSLSMLALLREVGLRPTCVGGHSYGELTALHAAGAYGAQELLALSRARGELMAGLAGDGTMIAVTASIAQVEELLESGGDGVVVANHNGPDQVVLSGAVTGIAAVEAALTAAGLRHQRLTVSAAFHSPMVAPVTAGLRAYLEEVDVHAPVVPVYSNSLAAPYPGEPAAIRETLAQSLARRVRFAEQIEAMWASGARTFVEVGPGTALSGMLRKILVEREHEAIALDARGRDGVTSLWRALGRLVVAGHSVELTSLWREYQLAADPRDAPKPGMKVEISGTNVGKKYPPPPGAASQAVARPAPPAPLISEPPPSAASRGIMTSMSASTPSAELSSNGHNGHHKSSGSNGTSPRHSGSNGHNGHGDHGDRAAIALEESMALTANPSTVAEPFASLPVMAPSWVDAVVEIQARTAEAHVEVMRTMAEAHLAFLRMAEGASLPHRSGEPHPVERVVAAASPRSDHGGLRSFPSARQVAPPPAAASTPMAAPRAPSSVASASALAPGAPLAFVSVASSATPPVSSAPASALAATSAPAATRIAARPPSEAFADALARRDFKSMVFQAVSTVTGYPDEVLTVEQSLESDLGIDSISRVEILASFSDLIPDMSKLDLGEVGHVKTLADVIQFVERNADRLAATGAASPA